MLIVNFDDGILVDLFDGNEAGASSVAALSHLMAAELNLERLDLTQIREIRSRSAEICMFKAVIWQNSHTESPNLSANLEENPNSSTYIAEKKNLFL